MRGPIAVQASYTSGREGKVISKVDIYVNR